MKLRKKREIAVALGASAAMAMGIALAAAGTAAAADRYEGPTLKVEQGDFGGGKNVELTLTNPTKAAGAFSETTCTSALLDGQQGLEAFVAYNTQDYGKLVSILASPGLHLGPAASNNLLSPGPNTAGKTVQVGNGVYFYLGTCGGWNTALDPTTIGVSVLPVIVPSGVGSVESVVDFGSTALEAGAGIADLLPLLSAS